MNANMPSVLIVILNYGTYDLTLKMIQEIKDKLEYDNYSILVIDNCSPNESAKILGRESKKLGYHFIANCENKGYAAGNNIGIHYAISQMYKYSWIINNDLVLTDHNILIKLVKVAEENESVACVGPKITDLNGNIVAPYIERPTRWSQTLGIGIAKKKRIAHCLTSGIVYRVYGCCMLVKNSTIQKADFMDERTFLYCEEDILAERLLKINAYSYYCAEADVIHLESMTVNKWNKGKTQLVIKSMDLYLKEYLHYGIVSRFLCETVRKIIMMIR